MLSLQCSRIAFPCVIKHLKLLKNSGLTRVFLFVQAVICVKQTFRRNVDDDGTANTLTKPAMFAPFTLRAPHNQFTPRSCSGNNYLRCLLTALVI